MAKWNNVPWPQPDSDSVHAVLGDYGITVTNGQYSVPPDLIERLTPEDNQFLSAAGVFGTITESNVKGADFSRYSGVVTDSLEGGGFRGRVYRDGKVVLDRKFTSPPDTLELWTEATAE